jgi:hypothetical protein
MYPDKRVLKAVEEAQGIWPAMSSLAREIASKPSTDCWTCPSVKAGAISSTENGLRASAANVPDTTASARPRYSWPDPVGSRRLFAVII